MKDHTINIKIIDRWMELDENLNFLYYILMEIGNQIWLTERNHNDY